MLKIFTVAILALGGLATGAVWSRHQVAASLRAEIQSRKRAEYEARAVDRARSELLANARRELRASLNGILGKADLLLAADLPAAERRRVESLDKSAEALLALVDELLDSSKTESSS